MNIYTEIEKSFSEIEKLFSEETLLEFKTTRIFDLCNYHFGLGTWIRNNLLYPKESTLHSLFLENGIEEPDDMAALMISLFHYYSSST